MKYPRNFPQGIKSHWDQLPEDLQRLIRYNELALGDKQMEKLEKRLDDDPALHSVWLALQFQSALTAHRIDRLWRRKRKE